LPAKQATVLAFDPPVPVNMPLGVDKVTVPPVALQNV
jgi:hypothetical protein